MTEDEILGQTIPENTLVSPEQEQEMRDEQDNKDELLDFSKAKTRLMQLNQSWSYEIKETQRRRLLRNVDINPEALRAAGKLLADETMVPMRIIDTNIRREQPSYINFLRGTNRLAVFECIEDPNIDVQRLEAEFSRVMTYVGWEKPHYKCLDGSQTHGWDAIEVVSDDTLPGTLGIEHIGHERLIFNLESLDFQANEIVLRAYSFSLLQLKKATKQHGFDKKQVKQLELKLSSGIATNSSTPQTQQSSTKDRNILVYKKYCKYDGQVFVSWFSFDCDDWLKAPQPLSIGRKRQEQVMVEVPNPEYAAYMQMMDMSARGPEGRTLGVSPDTIVEEDEIVINSPGPQIPQVVPPPPTIQQPEMQWVDVVETEYPIFILPYSETEEQEIAAHKGRVFLDQHKQEAQTSICSGYINGLNRASNIYGSVDNPADGSTAAPKQLDTPLQPSGIYDRKINFWATPYPDPSVLSGMQWLDSYNSAEVGQVNFAVNNRQDSRKTATEISTANQQQAALSSVQVSLYSAHLREVYSFVWPIIQSRAMAGLIKFLQIVIKQDIDMLTQKPRNVYANDIETIKMTYNVKAAGDIDVIQRMEMLQRMKQDWPVFSQTPLAMSFLTEMITLSYPTKSKQWIPILQQADPKIIAQQLSIILQGVLQQNPDILATISPQEQQQVMQLMQQASAQPAMPEGVKDNAPQQSQV